MTISIPLIVAAALIAIMAPGLFILITRGAWVPRPLARYYALKGLSEFVVVGEGPPGSTPDYDNDWRIDNFLRPDGTALFLPENVRSVFDVKGRVLFYELTVGGIAGNRELRVRVAANFALGVPVVSIGVNAPLPIDQWIDLARATAKVNQLTPIDEGCKYPVGQNPAIVCYSFPLLGLLCRNAAGKRYIIRLDTQTQYEVDRVRKPGTKSKTETEPKPESEAEAEAESESEPVSVSVLESESIRDGGHMVSSPLDFSSHWSAPRNLVRHAAYAHVLAAAPPLKKRKRSPRLRPTEGKLLKIPNIPQEKRNYCAPATAQMILRYDFKKKGKSFRASQDDIADAMKVPGNGVDGVDLRDQQLGYADITSNEFSAERDRSPKFLEACNEINHDRPLVSRTPGHIRAAVGWARKHPETHMIGEFIFINDPYPQHYGERRWEDWMGPTPDKPVTHYFYVRPKAP